MILEDKVLVKIYIVKMDNEYETFIPVNDKVGNILRLFEKSLLCKASPSKLVVLNAYSGNVYKNNDLIRDTDIKNGTSLILL